MGNKIIGIAFIFIGIVFLIFGAGMLYVWTLLSGMLTMIPAEAMVVMPFIDTASMLMIVMGVLLVITAILSFVAGIQLIRYKEQ